MKLSIVVLTPGPTEGKVIPVKVKQFLIGRDPGCHLRPDSKHISKRHCALLRREGKVFLRDFGSTNGTFINDQQIRASEIELRDGDRLRVGQLLFAVCLEPAFSADNDEDAAAMLQALQQSEALEAGPPTAAPDVTTMLDDSVATLADRENESPT